MRIVFLTSFLAFAGGGCSERRPASETMQSPEVMREYPIVRVDLDHYQVERKDGTEAQTYKLQAAEAIILDTTLHQPAIDSKFGSLECNSVQVVLGNERQYSAAYDTRVKQHLLDRKTLRANSGSVPFAGFKPGDSCIIAIGNMREETGKQPAFSVAWASLAEIQ